MKILCLKGSYNIQNIPSLFFLLESDKYDYIDFSDVQLDHYSSILVDSYNNHIQIPSLELAAPNSIFFRELHYLFSICLFSHKLFFVSQPSFQVRYFYSNIVSDLYHMAVETFLVVAFISFFLGINFGHQSYLQLIEFGLADTGLALIVLASFKQSGLWISFVILTAKYASAVIAKVGFMKLSEEWTALQIMKIDPKVFLLKTKVYSLMILLPFFAYVSIFFSTLGAFWIFKIFHGTTFKFLLSTAIIKDFKVLLTPFFKGVPMGIVLGIVASYEAFSIKKNSENMLIALNHGIVMALLLGSLLSVLLDLIFKL